MRLLGCGQSLDTSAESQPEVVGHVHKRAPVVPSTYLGLVIYLNADLQDLEHFRSLKLPMVHELA